MDNQVRTDILGLYRRNPLLRDTAEEIAHRIARSPAHVQQALDEMETAGLVAKRWVSGAALYSFTGAPESTPDAESGSDTIPDAIRAKTTPILKARLTTPSTFDGVSTGRSSVEALCRVVHMPAPAAGEFLVAVSEAITNAHRYGRRGDGRDWIRIDVVVNELEIEVVVQDRGSGFPALLVGSGPDDMQSTGGRGFMLMRSLTDRMEVKRSRTGTSVTLVKSMQPPKTE
ncbi:MAG TPA: ATP-binding protein [Armatimonadota bacterium]|nr:ATP-binding protein [Armatimonadota bacterium]